MGKDWDRLGPPDLGAGVRHRPAYDGRKAREGTDASFGAGVRYGLGSDVQEWHQAWATEALRVLKPGGHLLAFGGSRTYHRLVCAVEDAGFEIRDTISWLYGSGFPKSLNVGNGFGTALKPAHEPVVVARKPLSGTVAGNVLEHGVGALNVDGCRVGHASEADLAESQAKNPGRDDLVSSDVYGNGRPQQSVNVAGRWPANVVLSHTEGCVQVGTRKVKASAPASGPTWTEQHQRGSMAGEHKGMGDKAPANYASPDGTETVGAWSCTPDCAVRLLDEQTGDLRVGGDIAREPIGPSAVYGEGWERQDYRTDQTVGGASRFFYVAKASRGERNAGLEGFEERAAHKLDGGDFLPDGRNGSSKELTGRNVHPTVKPISLMRWLVRLVTPSEVPCEWCEGTGRLVVDAPDEHYEEPCGHCGGTGRRAGTVLDPFTGSGTTGCAVVLEGFDFIGLERESEYVKIAEARIAWWHKHRGDGEAAEILAAGELRDEVEATGQLGMFDQPEEE